MKKEIIEFFESNPEATEVHDALGYLMTDKEKAVAMTAGTCEVVKTYTREQFLQYMELSGKEQADIELARMTVEGIQARINEQEAFIVSEKEAQAKLKTKAMKDLAEAMIKKEYEKLEAMKVALVIRAKEEGKELHIVTEQTLELNPEMVEQGVKVGDVIELGEPCNEDGAPLNSEGPNGKEETSSNTLASTDDNEGKSEPAFPSDRDTSSQE